MLHIGINKLFKNHGCYVTVWSPARRSLQRRQGYKADFQRSFCCARAVRETSEL